MISADDLKITLADIIAVLSARQIKFHLTGGIASSFYGEPRFTQDIDIVIRVAVGSQLNGLIEGLSHKFILDHVIVEGAVRRKSLFQVLHEETMIKIDFHIGEAIEGELERSRNEEILTGITVPLVSNEDAILSKLIWIKKGSAKSQQDVQMMLKRNSNIDMDYLRKQAAKLDLEAILNSLTMQQ